MPAPNTTAASSTLTEGGSTKATLSSPSSLSPSSSSSSSSSAPQAEAHELTELKAVRPPSPPDLAIEQDITRLAQLGDIPRIKELFDTGAYSITYADEQGITPLHVRIHTIW